MTVDGGTLAVYLTGAAGLSVVAVQLSTNLQTLLGPVGRYVARRRAEATTRAAERMAAAAKITGTITDAARLEQLTADVTYWQARADNLDKRAGDAEERAGRAEQRAARAEDRADDLDLQLARLRTDYGRRLEELGRQLDDLILDRRS